MQTLITGAEGFVARHLQKQVPQAVLSTRDSNSLSDRSALAQLVQANDFDVIYHLAAMNSGASFNPAAIDQLNSNVLATYNLIEAIQLYAKKPPILVLMSSIHVYKMGASNVITETTPTGPKSFYGFTKLSQEEIVLDAANRSILKAVVFRSTHLYGPGSRPNYNSFIATLCNDIEDGKPITLTGGGLHSLNLVYIDDVVKIMVKSAELARAQAQVFNLASNDNITVAELAEKLGSFSGKKPSIQFSSGEPVSYQVSNEKLQSALNYQHWTPLDVGLQLTYESINK